MAETKYEPIKHDHKAFLRNAKRRSGFQEAYQALAVEYEIANAMLAARARARLTQEVVASRMGTSKTDEAPLEKIDLLD